MPPHSYLEWIAGANMPRPHTARPKRRIFAEYETDDEDEEVEFLVRSNKKSPKKSKEKDKEKEKPAAKEPSLKSALKKGAAAASDISDSALSSDKEVETSGSEVEATSASTSASASVVDDHARDFDPECPCLHCVKAQKALKKSRLGRKAKRVSFSDDEDDTDASDDAETVHNFFKWNQAMEAKKARDKDAKDYKEYLADKAKKEEAAQKEAEKQKEDALREKIKKEEETKRQQEKKKEEESKKKEEKEKGKGKQGKPKDNKDDSSSKVTTEPCNSEANTTKNGTDAETSETDSQKGAKPAAKAKDKKPAKTSPPPSEPSESDTQEATAMQLLMEQLLKKQKKDKSKKKKGKSKREGKEMEKPEQEKSSVHPASSHDPNWLMPPRSSIVHVEHSMEAPTDPRPNAFFDNQNGVMRVYHGPNYGNPAGGLYQKQGPGSVTSPQHGNFNKNSHGCGSGFPPQPYGQYPGFPPPHAAQSMPQMPPANADHWFQGSGTTVVPGTPAGGQRNPEFAKPFPSGFHSFTDLTSHSPHNTHRQHVNPSDQATRFKPSLPSQSPGFDPAYFNYKMGKGLDSFNNTNPGWGVQNTQSVNTSSTPSNNDQYILMAKELEALKARMDGSIGGNRHGQPSGVQTVPPAQRTSPPNPVEAGKTNDWSTGPNASPAKEVNATDTWNTHASAAPASAGNDTWPAPANNNTNSPQKASSCENGDNNDTTAWNTNNYNSPNTSPTDFNNSNNDNTAGSFQNVSEWFSQPSAQAQVSMPGAYPSPSMTTSVKNDFGSADWNTSQDNNAQDWGDVTAANTSDGFWESGAPDASKGPATAGW